jgi:hypothetical protein
MGLPGMAGLGAGRGAVPAPNQMMAALIAGEGEDKYSTDGCESHLIIAALMAGEGEDKYNMDTRSCKVDDGGADGW